MKKLFLTLCVALFSVGAFAQEKGEMAVGGTFNYNTDASMIGVGARFQYFFIDNLRGDAEATYYFKKDGCQLLTAVASAHYLFNIADGFSVYPMAGFGLGYSKVDGVDVKYEGIHIESEGASTTDWIGQVGGGVQYFFTEKIAGTAEVKYQFNVGDCVVLSAGIIYKF